MKKEIVDFIVKACKRYKMTAVYYPDNDVYALRKNGRAVQNFTTSIFYDLPKQVRMSQYLPLINRGLMRNSGERSIRDNLYPTSKMGKKIYG